MHWINIKQKRYQNGMGRETDQTKSLEKEEQMHEMCSSVQCKYNFEIKRMFAS